MNKRIEKLAREAALAEGWGPGVWQTTFTEKFAELIIRECAKLRHKNVVVGGVSEYNRGRRELSEEILKHFGVEE